jgi:ribosome maturation factor RimP
MAHLRERLLHLLTPPVEQLGYEILQLDWTREGKDSVLLLVIDHPERTVNIDDCVAVNKVIDPLLDEADLISSEYRLDVSTPGIDRPLLRPKHYDRFRGERVAVLLKRSQGGHKRWTGTLQQHDETSVEILSENGTSHRFAFQDIDSVHLDPLLFG